MEEKHRHLHRMGGLSILSLSAMLIAALACSLFPPPAATPQGPQATEPPATQAPPLPATQPPPPPPTAVPPTAEPTASVLAQVSGMWSGCPPQAGTNVMVQPCTLTQGGYPQGNFLTLFILPSCSIDQPCGKYIKGRFESEFIPFLLIFKGVSGSEALFYGDSGTGMFEGMDRDIEVELAGGRVRIAESTGESYLLPPGCDPIIDSNFRCIDDVP
jgi:hypothetical protein